MFCSLYPKKSHLFRDRWLPFLIFEIILQELPFWYWTFILFMLTIPLGIQIYLFVIFVTLVLPSIRNPALPFAAILQHPQPLYHICARAQINCRKSVPIQPVLFARVDDPSENHQSLEKRPLRLTIRYVSRRPARWSPPPIYALA